MESTLILLLLFTASVSAGGTFKTPICVELDEPLTVTSEGTSKIILQGQITGAESFHMFLIDGWSNVCSIAHTFSNIALAIVPRVVQNHVVGNYYANETSACIKSCATGWGTEARNTQTPFAIGTPFEIVIVCELSFFQIFVNGKHLFSYPYYIKIEKMTHIKIVGSASFRKIDIVRPVGDSNSALTNNCEPKYCNE